MSTEIRVITNPPDFMDNDDEYKCLEGQTVVLGDIILADNANLIIPHKSNLILES